MNLKSLDAKIISLILHPLLLPTYTVIYMFSVKSSYLSLFPYQVQKAIFLIVFLMTFVAPVLSVLLMLNLKIISSLKLENKEERIFPFLVTGIFYISTYFILINFPITIPKIVSLFLLLSAISVFLITFINIKLKISAHTAGLGGVLGYLYSFHFIMQIDAFVALSIVILIASLVSYSRLKLKAHTILQISLGFLVGLIIGVSAVFVL